MLPTISIKSAGFGLALALLLPVPVFAQANVTTQHNDAGRTGANLNETVLTTTNVNVSQFGKLFERVVDDEIYVQPLYVEGVNIPGVGIRNVVYVATNNDSVYAFDADDPAASAPIWRTNYRSTRSAGHRPCRGSCSQPRARAGRARRQIRRLLGLTR